MRLRSSTRLLFKLIRFIRQFEFHHAADGLARLEERDRPSTFGELMTRICPWAGRPRSTSQIVQPGLHIGPLAHDICPKERCVAQPNDFFTAEKLGVFVALVDTTADGDERIGDVYPRAPR